MTDETITTTTASTTTPAPVNITWSAFLWQEVQTVVAPADVMLQQAGGSGAQLLAATSATTSMAVSSTMHAFDARRFVRGRRLFALWFSMWGAVLPATPLVSGLVQLVLGVEGALGLVVTGAVFLVPLSLVGLIIGVKLSPFITKLLRLAPTT